MLKLDLLGQRFARLLVVDQAANINRRGAWSCRCDCGCIIVVTTSSLRTGNTRSCGCLATENKKAMHVTHGHSAEGLLSPEYVAWSSMVARGTGKTNRVNYADRGITVCERWLTFELFLADMGPRPSGTSLDRRDNDRGYFPGNCRWATRSQQARNTRRNHLLVVDGRTASIAEWAEETGLEPGTIWARIARGWTDEAAVSQSAVAS